MLYKILKKDNLVLPTPPRLLKAEFDRKVSQQKTSTIYPLVIYSNIIYNLMYNHILSCKEIHTSWIHSNLYNQYLLYYFNTNFK